MTKTGRAEFAAGLGAVLARWRENQGRAPWEAAQLAPLEEALWAEVARPEGWGAALDEPDTDGERRMTTVAAEVAARVALEGLEPKVVRQLLLVCALDAFTKCRDSWWTNPGRRDRATCRARLSGAHCVDCPWWLDQPDPAAHRTWMETAWQAGGAEPDLMDAGWDDFLPEDWRAWRWTVRACKAANPARV